MRDALHIGRRRRDGLVRPVRQGLRRLGGAGLPALPPRRGRRAGARARRGGAGSGVRDRTEPGAPDGRRARGRDRARPLRGDARARAAAGVVAGVDGGAHRAGRRARGGPRRARCGARARRAAPGCRDLLPGPVGDPRVGGGAVHDLRADSARRALRGVRRPHARLGADDLVRAARGAGGHLASAVGGARGARRVRRAPLASGFAPHPRGHAVARKPG